MRRLLPLLLLAGCSNSVEGIPCTDYNDLECPTGYWCKSDLLVNTRWVCVDETEVTKPNIEFLGAYKRTVESPEEIADSDFSDRVSVDGRYAEVVMRFRNTGGSGRFSPKPAVESSCCLDAPSTIGLSAFPTIGTDETFDMSFDLRRISVDCEESVPFTLNVGESESGREYEFTFQMDVEPYVDDGTCDSCDYISSSNCD